MSMTDEENDFVDEAAEIVRMVEECAEAFKPRSETIREIAKYLRNLSEDCAREELFHADR